MGLTSSSAGEWVPTLYRDFRENLNVPIGISANAAHGDGTDPGMEARELGLTLVCLYCRGRFQARISLSVSLFLNEQ